MTLVASGNPIALKDAGANTGGSTTYYINDTSWTKGSKTLVDMSGDYDTGNDEEEPIETLNTGRWNFYGWYTSNNWLRQAQTWDGVGGTWDDEDNIHIDNSNDYFTGSIGSNLTAAYTDGTSTLRTISLAGVWDQTSAGDNQSQDIGDFFMFELIGSNPPNNDNTFHSIQFGSLTLTRASADYNWTSQTSGRVWVWELTTSQTTSAGASTGAGDLKVIASTGGTAPNNGIVEEFGDTTGAPHALSEFYKGGNNVSSNVTASIPTSGTISFSDFYGATFAAAETVHHTTTFYPDFLSIFNYGSYIKYGGYHRPGAGFQTETGSTPADIDFDPNGVTTFMGHTTDDVDIEGVYTYFTGSSDSSNWSYFEVKFEMNGSNLSTSNTNISSNFSKIEVYDGNTTSGTPLISADVSNADATGTINTGGSSAVDVRVRWTAANTTVSGAKTFTNVFGTNTTAALNGIHTIKIIK